MVKTILVPTDGSDHAGKAVDFAADLAQKYGADLILLHIVSDPGSGRVPDELRGLAKLEHVQITEADIRQAAANEILQQAVKRAHDHGIDGVETVIGMGDPTRTILDNVETRKADLIVMGSRGLGDLKGLLLGSVSHKISHLAPCTCITVR